MVEIIFLRREAEQFLQEALQSGDEARILVCEELLDDLQYEENAIRMSGEEDAWREAQRKQRQEDRVYFELEAVAEEKRQARLRFLDEEAVRLYNEYQRLGKELETMLSLETWLAEKMGREDDPAYVKSLFSPRIDQAWRDYKRAMLERGVLRGALTPVSGPRTASPDDLGALRDIKVDTLLTSKVFGAGRGRFRAICPFHTEKTGSFFIFSDNSWHCFGCGAHGKGAIDFIIKRDNCVFVEAIKTLKEFYT